MLFLWVADPNVAENNSRLAAALGYWGVSELNVKLWLWPNGTRHVRVNTMWIAGRTYAAGGKWN